MILALAPYTGTEVAVVLLDVDPMFSIEWEGGESYAIREERQREIFLNKGVRNTEFR